MVGGPTFRCTVAADDEPGVDGCRIPSPPKRRTRRRPQQARRFGAGDGRRGGSLEPTSHSRSPAQSRLRLTQQQLRPEGVGAAAARYQWSYRRYNKTGSVLRCRERWPIGSFLSQIMLPSSLMVSTTARLIVPDSVRICTRSPGIRSSQSCTSFAGATSGPGDLMCQGSASSIASTEPPFPYPSSKLGPIQTVLVFVNSRMP